MVFLPFQPWNPVLDRPKTIQLRKNGQAIVDNLPSGGALRSRSTRILIVKRGAAVVQRAIASRFPGAELSTCERNEDLPDTVAAVRPEVALVFKIDGAPFPRDAMLAAPTLKWVHVSTAGVDHIASWDAGRITVTNSAGVHDEVVANYVIGAILAVNSHFLTFLEQQKARQWLPRELDPTSSQCALIIGFGRIGSRVGRLAKALGMNVIGVRNRPSPSRYADQIVRIECLDEVLPRADFVVVTVPYTASSKNLITYTQLEKMKSTCWLINVSRGGVVDEDALCSVLHEGRLGGAFVDVFLEEPLPRSSPLWTCRNLVVTPHTGDAAGWVEKVTALFCDNLERYEAGRELTNIVDPVRGY